MFMVFLKLVLNYYSTYVFRSFYSKVITKLELWFVIVDNPFVYFLLYSPTWIFQIIKRWFFSSRPQRSSVVKISFIERLTNFRREFASFFLLSSFLRLRHLPRNKAGIILNFIFTRRWMNHHQRHTRRSFTIDVLPGITDRMDTRNGFDSTVR